MKRILHTTSYLAVTLFFVMAWFAPNPVRFDGPYVFYNGDKFSVHYINSGNEGATLETHHKGLAEKDSVVLHVATDVPGETFEVRLRKELKNAKPEHKNVTKQFVVSDIEGNFEAFRKLLVSNEVIDNNFNWTFGNGHLVLTGDFVDRGNQVTEVLWLIYSLEEKALAAGGQVHFILGNHEIMILGNDLRYVNKKYDTTSKLLGKNYSALFGRDSELGRWLRTKNIVERIGDVIYMHGGYSPLMNMLDINLSRLNDITRPHLGDTIQKFRHPELHVIYSDDGPFWYRGYYKAGKISNQQIDSTLSNFRAKYIATGHSLVADTISVWHNGKVLNTDTHHATGKSEALYIDGNTYYRANARGEKFILFQR